MYFRLLFSVVLVGLLASFVGCNPQQALWDKYDANWEIVVTNDDVAITLPAARDCFRTLKEIKKENPSAKNKEGKSVDENISSLESLIGSMESLSDLNESSRKFDEEMERIDRDFGR